MTDLSCKELFERLTEFLEGAGPEGFDGDVRAHLEECSGCRRLVSQMSTTLSATHAFFEREAEVAATTESELREPEALFDLYRRSVGAPSGS